MQWQREPALEGRIAETALKPAATLAEVLSAFAAGAKSIRVMCTSSNNRHDLAGRTAAALAEDGPVIVTYPRRYMAVVRFMLDGDVPKAEIGFWSFWKDNRKIRLVEFSELKNSPGSALNRGIVLSPPLPRNPSDDPSSLYQDAKSRLGTGAGDSILIEFALSHSLHMLASAAVIIDASRTE